MVLSIGPLFSFLTSHKLTFPPRLGSMGQHKEGLRVQRLHADVQSASASSDRDQ